MVSRILKVAAATIATLSLASTASANCGSSLYCGQTGGASMSSSSSYSSVSNYGTGASYSLNGTSSRYSPSTAYTTTMSAIEADATYGTGSISETYSGGSTYSFSGSPQSVAGLGANESLQATNCPVNVHGAGEGTVIGCYNVVKPVPQTSYYRVVRPVVYVRYPVPVAVPYTSPCHTVTHYSRYGDWGAQGFRGGCR